MNRPRSREHFPRMKERGKRRRARHQWEVVLVPWKKIAAAAHETRKEMEALNKAFQKQRTYEE
ncbi:hypothetical protein [Acaricomes phytoseiuli]|uniref:hypothetical protein n=1 Tax=Acaricomes phytoseiuli TaxID=291968 RepID=UPI0003820CE4|nr:hypothetical protein [Acaricomes phytoseiuli]